MNIKLSTLMVRPLSGYLFGFILCIVGLSRTWAAPGDLDATFGSTEGGLLADPGIALIDYGTSVDEFGAVLHLPDGKFLAVGDSSGANDLGEPGVIGLARLNANGSFDSTFSGDGRLIQRFADPETNDPQPLSWFDAALQSDGKIVITGTTSTSVATPEFPNWSRMRMGVTRLNADGSIDTGFGINGGVKLGFGIDTNESKAYAVAIQSDGKIVVAGDVVSADGSNRNFAIARFNTNGTLDASFDGDGKLITDFGANQDDAPSELRIQSDGKILVAGYATLAAGAARQFSVVRYNTNGSLDTTFSGDGIATATTGVANDLAIQSDGKIVAVGHNNGGTSQITRDFVVVRFNTNGSLDTTFGSGGIKMDVLGLDNFANAVALQSDGKILVSGGLQDLAQYDFLLARYTANGALDPTFDTSSGTADGRVRTPVFYRASNPQSGALDMLVQTDGKVVLGGWVSTGVTLRGQDAVLLRYLTAEDPPAITSTPITTATINQPYQYQATANGPGVTWSLVSGPAGMAIGATTGLVTWTPSAAGTSPDIAAAATAHAACAAGA